MDEEVAGLNAALAEKVDVLEEPPFIVWRTRCLMVLSASFGASSVQVQEFTTAVRVRRHECGPVMARGAAVRRGKAVLQVAVETWSLHINAIDRMKHTTTSTTGTPTASIAKGATSVGEDVTATLRAADSPITTEIAALQPRLESAKTLHLSVSHQEGSSRMSTNELVKAGATGGADPRAVFVIYGRNRDARKEVFTFLRAIGLNPLEWAHIVGLTGQASPYVGDVLTAGFEAAQAIVVLQTPDDIVYLDGDFCDLNNPDDREGEPQGQPRPNVFFEAGMAMGVSPDRTVIVEFGPIKHFSDISGRHTVRLDDSVAQRQALAQRLQNAGCQVDLMGPDWHTAGDLTPPKGPGKGRPLGKRLPKAERTKFPRLDGRLVDLGGKKIPLIEITNHGPGDALDLDIVDLPSNGQGELRKYGDTFPFPRLPANKSINVLRYIGGTIMGSGSVPALNIKAVARTEDGESFEQQIFISLGSR